MLTLQQLYEMGPEEIKKRFAGLSPNCGVCHKPITDEHPEETMQIRGKGAVHADCYYGELGDLIEKHPPGHAGIRRR